MPKTIDVTLRAKAIELRQAGLSLAAISTQTGISTGSLSGLFKDVAGQAADADPVKSTAADERPAPADELEAAPVRHRPAKAAAHEEHAVVQARKRVDLARAEREAAEGVVQGFDSEAAELQARLAELRAKQSEAQKVVHAKASQEAELQEHVADLTGDRQRQFEAAVRDRLNEHEQLVQERVGVIRVAEDAVLAVVQHVYAIRQMEKRMDVLVSEAKAVSQHLEDRPFAAELLASFTTRFKQIELKFWGSSDFLSNANALQTLWERLIARGQAEARQAELESRDAERQGPAALQAQEADGAPIEQAETAGEPSDEDGADIHED